MREQEQIQCENRHNFMAFSAENVSLLHHVQEWTRTPIMTVDNEHITATGILKVANLHQYIR